MEALDLLIAHISLGATGRNGPRHLFAWVWTPLLHSDR
jgi:hypothetical protein